MEDVILQHSNATPHSTHQTHVVADVSLGMHKPSALLFGLLKPCLGSYYSTITRKWKWLFVSGCTCKSPFSVVTEFFLTLAKIGQVHYCGLGLR